MSGIGQAAQRLQVLTNFLVSILFLCIITPVFAQSLPLKLGSSPAEKGAKDHAPSVSPPLEDLAAERLRTTSHLEEASKQLIDVRRALETVEGQLPDMDEQNHRERVSLLQERIQIARRHLDIIEEVQVVRDQKRQVQDDFNSWIGFSEQPPYDLSLIEEIAGNLKARQAAMNTDKLRAANFERGSVLAVDELEKTKKSFRQTLEALEAAGSDGAKLQARKQHARNQLQLQLSEEGVDFVRAGKQLLQEKLGLHHLSEQFLQKKLMAAMQSVHVGEAVFQKRNQALQSELTSAGGYLENCSTAEALARQRLEDVRQRIDAAQKNKEAIDPLLHLERQLRQKEREVILATIDDVNLHISTIEALQGFLRKLFSLQSYWELSQAKGLYEEFESILPVVEEGLSALDLAVKEQDDFKLEEQFSDPALRQARSSLDQAMNLRREQLNRTRQSSGKLLESIKLWKQLVKIRIGNMGLAEQAKGWKEISKGYLQRIWSFEILSVEDTIVVDGVRTLEKRPVTFGKAIQAVLILIIGLLVASLLARLVSRIVFPFSAMHEQRRLLIQKILRVVMVAGVVIFALVTVRIPLTVFAFLGGAIAIGIGFGAQNLLNNFISGFILLGESQIRVGDRIEIEGNEGIVKGIGDRCTRVRRLDGVEILIPNSQLLERSVTNMTLSDRHIRKTIKVGVAYGSPTRLVQNLLLEIIKSHHLVVVDPEPAVVFEDFGDNALIFCAYFWLDFASQKDFRAVISELRHTIGERFADQGLEIAFPQRDVHLEVKTPIAVQVQSSSETG